LVRFLTSLLATISLLLLFGRQHLLAVLLRLVVFTLADAGNILGHDDDVGGDDDDARRACGHIAPPPRAVAIAASADDLTARFLSCRLMSPFLQDLRLTRKLLRKPCLKDLAVGPLIALLVRARPIQWTLLEILLGVCL
jgi:hypothetical protein